MIETQQKLADSKDALAEDISFGLQQTLLCLSTDGFTDPLIADKIQRMAQPQVAQGHAHLDHNVKENQIAEVAGDGIGLVAFIALRQLFRPAFDAAHKSARAVLNPLYDGLVRGRLHLTGKTDLTEKETRHLGEMKNFEAETFLKANELSLFSTVANVGMMKAQHSKYSLPTLFLSKFAATTVTTVSMIALRMFMPRTMRTLDSELTDNLIEPVIKGVHRVAGVKHVPTKVDHELYESALAELKEHDRWQDRVQQSAVLDEPQPIVQQSR